MFIDDVKEYYFVELVNKTTKEKTQSTPTTYEVAGKMFDDLSERYKDNCNVEVNLEKA